MSATLVLRETTSGLGGPPTAIEVSNTPMNNIFDDVTFTEAASGDSEYRAVDLYNSGDAAAVSVDFYMSVPTTSPDTLVNMGIEASHLNSTTSIGSESNPPSGVSFSYYDSGTKLSINDIPAGEYARIWLQRVVSIGAGNIANDLGTISFSYA